MPNDATECLRVALVVGTLRQGGAEKQLVYMARALKQVGVDVRAFALTQGEHYEASLSAAGVPIEYVGQRPSRLWRLGRLIQKLRAFRPHVVQASHFYCNPYAAYAGRMVGATGIGASRSDVVFELDHAGRLGRWFLKCPAALIANSQSAIDHLSAIRKSEGRAFVVPNAIELEEFDRCVLAHPVRLRCPGCVRVVAVGGMQSPAKRFDIFLCAMAEVQRLRPMVEGFLVGDGPLRSELENRCRALGLSGVVTFLGHRSDVPALLQHMDIHVLCSEHEGCPNVILEAMAAGLPVVTTPAGDAGVVVQHDLTGLVVGHDDPRAMACAIARLAEDDGLRSSMGAAGRARVAQEFASSNLGARLLKVYASLRLDVR